MVIVDKEGILTEREKLVMNCYGAMPLVNQLFELDRKFVRYYKTKSILSGIIVFFAFVFVLYVLFSVFWLGFSGFMEVILSFALILIIPVLLYKSNNKKISRSKDEMNKILNSEELSFIPSSYLNTYDVVGIYMVAVEDEANTLKDAIDLWEKKKHMKNPFDD